MTVTARRPVALVLLLIWVAAIACPVATTQHSYANQTFTGFGMLFLGIIGPLELMFSWYANPLLLIGLWRARSARPPSPRMMLWIGAALCLLAVNALFWHRIPDDSGENPIIAYHAGYFLWLAAVTLGGVWFLFLGATGRRSDRDVTQ